MTSGCDNCRENDCDLGEIAGNTLLFVMKQLPPELKGINFTKTMIEIFTLCIIEEVNLLIKKDLNLIGIINE